MYFIGIKKYFHYLKFVIMIVYRFSEINWLETSHIKVIETCSNHIKVLETCSNHIKVTLNMQQSHQSDLNCSNHIGDLKHEQSHFKVTWNMQQSHQGDWKHAEITSRWLETCSNHIKWPETCSNHIKVTGNRQNHIKVTWNMQQSHQGDLKHAAITSKWLETCSNHIKVTGNRQQSWYLKTRRLIDSMIKRIACQTV